jgi:hypothetical protein
MVQSTLDAFVRPPAPAPSEEVSEEVSLADVPAAVRKAFLESVVSAMVLNPGDECEPTRVRHEVTVTSTQGGQVTDVEHVQHKEPKTRAEPKDAPRLHVAGASTVHRAIDAAREQHPEASVVLVTLSWRHSDPCGADRVITATELRGAAFDRRPPPKPKKGESKELPSTLGPDELIGLVDVAEEVVHLLLDDERTHVVVMDGYPKGESYARLLAGIVARCLKLRHAGKDVTLPRATAPADATCKAVLACLKKSRSVEAMRTAAVDYYNEHLADRFP